MFTYVSVCVYMCVCACAHLPLILWAPQGQVVCFTPLRIRTTQCLTSSGAQIIPDGEGRRATWLPGSSTPGRCRGMPSCPGALPILKRGLPPSCGFPGGSDGKESACSAGDLSSVPGLGRCPGRGHGPPQYSCLERLHGQRSPVDCSP